jgi:hypothetical protein
MAHNKLSLTPHPEDGIEHAGILISDDEVTAKGSLHAGGQTTVIQRVLERRAEKCKAASNCDQKFVTRRF